MKCEKCQDKGFTEENHGLIMVLCDCEAGRKKRAEIGLPEEEVNDSSNRIESDNPDIGGSDTSEPKQPSKPKKKKKARKRAK